ncbi:hypothetical protein [Streptomyces sp. NPDC021356]|uniref:hypothetical protein n=1 Tax=Streptomyces sp. NPDC021356 TaxID=3154900 RepID=UPI0033CEC38A
MPPGHSPGGLTTKIGLAADGRCRPQAFVPTAPAGPTTPPRGAVRERSRRPSSSRPQRSTISLSSADPVGARYGRWGGGRRRGLGTSRLRGSSSRGRDTSGPRKAAEALPDGTEIKPRAVVDDTRRRADKLSDEQRAEWTALGIRWWAMVGG